MAFDEDTVKESLKRSLDQIKEKETFEEAVSYIKDLIVDYYPCASPSLQKVFYSAVCDVESTLQTTYTECEFWLAGKKLFEVAERHFIDSSEREYMTHCISRACENLDNTVNQPEVLEALLNGQLNLDPVSPRPTLQIAQELLATLGVVAGSSQGMSEDNSSSERASLLMDEMVNTMEEISGFRNLIDSIEASIQGVGASRPMRPPPASKEVIEKLPIITVSEEMMARLGSDMECAVCRENMDISEKMQELPCKHLFHLLCLKPWLEMHNSCPICRHELLTDDDAYENWKQREREANSEMMLQIH